MAGEIDAAEARRKALRNGEEDPVVVAQRYLNIYRQMHIFSPDRKESFNKMLLELPPEILSILGTLPGGSILQDYVDDLAEKNGVAKTDRTLNNQSLDSAADQQAEILAAAIAKTQAQPRPSAPIQGEIPVGISTTVAMDKNFAAEFSKIMGEILQQQSAAQRAGLEKMSADLSKTQLYIAKALTENKKEQDVAIGTICKAIIQSQTALSSTLSGAKFAQENNISAASDNNGEINNTTQRLIEMVLSGQNQINARLDKVEELSAEKANDNIRLIAAFEKTQSEILKNIGQISSGNVPTVLKNDFDEEKLVKIISQSQENLVKTILSANLQQNNNVATQANNNANNIQINTPDNSAQLMLLIDKIASLQAANEQNLEKALTKAIEAQSAIYDKLSQKQTKELAEIIAQAIKDAGERVVYAPLPQSITVNQAVSPDTIAEEVVQTAPASVFEEPQDNNYQNENTVEYVSAEDSPNENVLIDNSAEENIVPEEPQTTVEVVKKKKKKKKKKKTSPDAAIISESNFRTDETDFIKTEDFLMPEENNVASDNILSQNIKDSIDNDAVAAEIEQEFVFDDSFETDSKSLTGSDWGFVETPETQNDVSNDNSNDQDWEWAYVADEDYDYNDVEAIGDNSFIYRGDLYNQEQASGADKLVYGSTPIIMKKQPKIFDNANDEETIDPYQNSILKD